MEEQKTNIAEEKPEFEPFSITKLELFIQEEFKEALDVRSDYDALLLKFWNDWRDIKMEKILPFIGCSNWSIPITSSAMNTVIPRIIRGVWLDSDPLYISATNRTGEPWKDKFKKFAEWRIDTDLECRREQWLNVVNTCWSGTGIQYTYLDAQREPVNEDAEKYVEQVPQQLEDGSISFTEVDIKDPDRPDMLMAVNDFNNQILSESGKQFSIKKYIKKTIQWKKYQPMMKAVSIFNVYLSADSCSFQDAWDNGSIFMRDFLTKDYLKRQKRFSKSGLYSNTNEKEIQEMELDQRVDLTDPARTEWTTETFSKSKRVSIIRCFLNFDVDDDGLEEKIVALYDEQSQKVLGWELYQYKHNKCPLIPHYIMPVPGKPFGIGYPELLYHIKGKLDFESNSLSDRMADSNDPVLLHTAKSGYNSVKHPKGFGRDWELLQIGSDSIRYLEKPKFEGNVFQVMSETQQWGNRLSSTDSATAGVSGVGDQNKTARGKMIVKQGGDIVFSQQVAWYSLSVTESYQQYFKLYQQYWGYQADREINDHITQIMDEPDNPLIEKDGSGKPQAIEILRQNFNIIMTACREDRDTEISKFEAIMPVVEKDEIFRMAPDKRRKIIVKQFKALGYRTAEEDVPTEDEIKEYQVKIQTEALQKQKQAELFEKAKQDAELEVQNGI